MERAVTHLDALTVEKLTVQHLIAGCVLAKGLRSKCYTGSSVLPLLCHDWVVVVAAAAVFLLCVENPRQNVERIVSCFFSYGSQHCVNMLNFDISRGAYE